METLKKSIGFWQGMLLALTLVIGSGVFGSPGLALELWSPREVAVGWIATIIGAFPLVFMLARLGVHYPSAGGISKYVVKAIGPWGEDAIAMLILGVNFLGVPALGLVIASYVQQFLGVPPHTQGIVAVCLFACAGLIQIRGVRFASSFNLISTILMVGLFFFMITSNWDSLEHGVYALSSIGDPGKSIRYEGVWQTSVILFWAFIGWEELSFGLEEFRNPNRNIPLVYFGSFFLVSILYLALGLTTVGATLGGTPIFGEGALSKLLPEGYVGILLGCMAAVGCANVLSNAFAYSRIVFSAGREGIFPKFLGKLNRRYLPEASILTCTLVYCISSFCIFEFRISLASIFEGIDQAFILMYLFCLVAYWKVEKSWVRFPVSLACTLSIAYFFSGMSWTLTYSLILVAAGFLRYRSRTAHTRAPKLAGG